MDKNTLLLIFILFLLSSQLLSITWDIGKATIYIIIILLILNSISPESAEIIKKMFIKIINLDSSVITNILYAVSRFILNLFYTKNLLSQIKPETEKILPLKSNVLPASLKQENNISEASLKQENNISEINKNILPPSLLPPSLERNNDISEINNNILPPSLLPPSLDLNNLLL